MSGVDRCLTRRHQALARAQQHPRRLLDQADRLVQAVAQNGDAGQDGAELIVAHGADDLGEVAARDLGDEPLGFLRLPGNARQHQAGQHRAEAQRQRGKHQAAHFCARRLGMHFGKHDGNVLVLALDFRQHQVPHRPPLRRFLGIEEGFRLVQAPGLDQRQHLLLGFFMFDAQRGDLLRQPALAEFGVVRAHRHQDVLERLRGAPVVVVGLPVLRVEHGVARRLPHLQALPVQLEEAGLARHIVFDVSAVGILDPIGGNHAVEQRADQQQGQGQHHQHQAITDAQVVDPAQETGLGKLSLAQAQLGLAPHARVQRLGGADLLAARAHAHRHVAAVHLGRHRSAHPVMVTVLAAVLDHPGPGAPGLDRRPEVAEGFGRHVRVAQDVVRLADQLIDDIAADLGEIVIDEGDPPFVVGMRNDRDRIGVRTLDIGDRLVVAHGHSCRLGRQKKHKRAAQPGPASF